MPVLLPRKPKTEFRSFRLSSGSRSSGWPGRPMAPEGLPGLKGAPVLDFRVLRNSLWTICRCSGRLTRVAHCVGRSVRRKRRPLAAVDNSALRRGSR